MSLLDRPAETFEDGFDFPFDDSLEQEAGLAFEFKPADQQELTINELYALGVTLTPPAKISVRSMQESGLMPHNFELDTAKLREISIIRVAESEFILALTDKDGQIRDIDFSAAEPLNTAAIADLLLEPMA